MKEVCNNYKELCSQNYIKIIKEINIISAQEKLLKYKNDEKLCDGYKNLCTPSKNEAFIYYSFLMNNQIIIALKIIQIIIQLKLKMNLFLGLRVIWL